MRMPDGRLLPVPHPEFVSVEPTDGRLALVWKADRRGGHSLVDLELVSELEVL